MGTYVSSTGIYSRLLLHYPKITFAFPLIHKEMLSCIMIHTLPLAVATASLHTLSCGCSVASL